MPAHRRKRKTPVPITPTKKARMKLLRDRGETLQSIADLFNTDKGTVSKNLKKLDVNPDPYAHGHRTGRPKSLDAHWRLRLRRKVLSGAEPDATHAHRALHPPCSIRTTRRAFVEMGLHGYRRRKCARLTPKHVKVRRAWAQELASWTPEDFNRIVFSDECRIERVPKAGPQWCRRGPNEAFEARNVKGQDQQGGGTVMVWGAISPRGVSRLVRCDNHMDHRKYITLLSRHLIPFLRDPIHNNSTLIFQQDGSPVHTAKAVGRYLASKDVETLRWPARSPDMSIIENLWAILKDRIWERDPVPETLDKIFAAAEDEWSKITEADLGKLYASMPQRIRALAKARGSYTRY